MIDEVLELLDLFDNVVSHVEEAIAQGVNSFHLQVSALLDSIPDEMMKGVVFLLCKGVIVFSWYSDFISACSWKIVV